MAPIGLKLGGWGATTKWTQTIPHIRGYIIHPVVYRGRRYLLHYITEKCVDYSPLPCAPCRYDHPIWGIVRVCPFGAGFSPTKFQPDSCHKQNVFFFLPFLGCLYSYMGKWKTRGDDWFRTNYFFTDILFFTWSYYDAKKWYAIYMSNNEKSYSVPPTSSTRTESNRFLLINSGRRSIF